MAIDPREKLRNCREDQIGVSVPRPLNGRLDGLVELANEAGEKTNRKELLSALILAADENGEDLAAAVRQYRTAIAADAVIEGQDDRRFLAPEPPRPGPRSQRR